MSNLKSVPRHAFDPEIHRPLVETTKKDLQNLLAKSPNVTQNELAGLAPLGENVLFYLSVFDREHPLQLGAARSIAQGKAGLLLLSNSPPGHSIDIAFGEHTVTLPSYGPESRSNVLAWHTGWYGALMSRDEPSLSALSSISDDVLRASPSQADEYAFAWKQALLAFRSNPSAALAHVERAVALTQEDQLRVSNKVAAVAQGKTYAMLGALASGDADKFQSALVSALEAHSAFWKKPKKNAQQPLGWVAWGPLALCCLARDRGLAINVESDYLLPYLIERRWQPA